MNYELVERGIIEATGNRYEVVYGPLRLRKILPPVELILLRRGGRGGTLGGSDPGRQEPNLYGTTYGGTLYKLSKTGKLTVLHSFAGGVDGPGPNARLLRDAKGNLYGTTGQGGTSRVGIVFKLTP